MLLYCFICRERIFSFPSFWFFIFNSIIFIPNIFWKTSFIIRTKIFVLYGFNNNYSMNIFIPIFFYIRNENIRSLQNRYIFSFLNFSTNSSFFLLFTSNSHFKGLFKIYSLVFSNCSSFFIIISKNDFCHEKL